MSSCGTEFDTIAFSGRKGIDSYRLNSIPHKWTCELDFEKCPLHTEPEDYDSDNHKLAEIRNYQSNSSITNLLVDRLESANDSSLDAEINFINPKTNLLPIGEAIIKANTTNISTIRIIGGESNIGISLDNVNYDGNIEILGIDTPYIRFNNVNIDEILIEGIQNRPIIRFDGDNEVDSLKIEKCNLKTITLPPYQHLEANKITFWESSIYDIDMRGLSVGDFKLYRSTVENTTSFKNSTIDTFDISNCHLNRLVVQSLESEKVVKIKNTSILDCVTFVNSNLNQTVLYIHNDWFPSTIDLRASEYNSLFIKSPESKDTQLVSLRGASIGSTSVEFKSNGKELLNIDLIGINVEKYNIHDNKSALSSIKWKIHKLEKRSEINSELNYIDQITGLANNSHPSRLHKDLIQYPELRKEILDSNKNLYSDLLEFESSYNKRLSTPLNLPDNKSNLKFALTRAGTEHKVKRFVEEIESASDDNMSMFRRGRFGETFITEYTNFITCHTGMGSLSDELVANAIIKTIAADENIRKDLIDNDFEKIVNSDLMEEKLSELSDDNDMVSFEKLERQLDELLESPSARIYINKMANTIDNSQISEIISSDSTPWEPINRQSQELSRLFSSFLNSQPNVSNDDIEELYIKMKKAASDQGNNQAASKFFYRERIHRSRKYISNIRSDPISKSAIKNISDLIGNVLFRATAGYGEKPGYAILSSILILILFSIIYLPFWGTERMMDIAILSLSSFVTLVQPGAPVVSNRILMLVTQIEGFIGVFMIGLFVFTLTRSVHR